MTIARSQMDKQITTSPSRRSNTMKKKPGLYANIHAKQKRIAEGSGEKMNPVNSEKAPSSKDFETAALTANTKYTNGGMVMPGRGMSYKKGMN